MTRLARLLKLLELLQSGRVCDSQDLAQLLGVSRRTVFRDIASLQDAGCRILFDEERRGYHALHRVAIPPSELTAYEALSLLLIRRASDGGSPRLPLLPEARSAAGKICANLPPPVLQRIESLAKFIKISFEPDQASSPHAAHFEAALLAAESHRCVRLECREEETEGGVRTELEIYSLVFLHGSWHIVGLSSLHREVRMWPFASLRNLETLERQYSIPERFSLERFLRTSSDPARPQPTNGSRETRRHHTSMPADAPLGLSRVADEIDYIARLVASLKDRAGGEETRISSELRQRIDGCIENMRHMLAGPASGDGDRRHESG